MLLVARDRRFRAVASTLLSQRGYTVLIGGPDDDIAELALRESAEVVLLDASASLTAAAREAAKLGSLWPPVGIVAVSAETQCGLAALPVLPKWSSFDVLFGAIDRAQADVAQNGAASAAR